MRIVRAAVEEIRLALPRPLLTSRGAVAMRRGLLLRLTSDAGVEGVGEASPAEWIGETSVALVADDLRRIVALAGERPDAARLHALVLSTGGGYSPAAMCAVDTALVDLEATRRGIAVCALLGGDPTATLPVRALLAGERVERLRDDAADAVAHGFRVLKLKVGATPLVDDVARVDAVRRLVGPGIALHLDANRAWTFAQARVALAALAPLGIALLEEPLRAPEPDDLAALAASAPIPLALDESIADAAALLRATSAGGVSALIVKAGRVGGPTRALALARVAAQRGLGVIVTDSIESAVGMGAALHIAAALATPVLAVGLGGARHLTDVEHALTAPLLRAAGPGLAVAAVSPAQAATHA
ncbi:MAG: o-succinylbenzoate synthase [Deltaproteobacteria bacterium]|nr:o-succinylbenzoate synthase [Deltaproteobacteria bacterium]